MASVFTRILEGEIPGRVVWKDDLCFALMTHRPIRPGHVLVVPRQEIDHWLNLESGLSAHLFQVAQSIGKGIQHAFQPTKVGLIIAGLEVRHVHLHLVPIDALSDLDFGRQTSPPEDELDRGAARVRDSLRALGYPQVAG